MSKAKRLQDKHFSPLLAAHEKEPHGADRIMGANHHAGGIHPDYYGNWKRKASVLLGSLVHEILAPRCGRCVGDMGIDGLQRFLLLDNRIRASSFGWRPEETNHGCFTRCLVGSGAGARLVRSGML